MAAPHKTTGSYGYGDLEAWHRAAAAEEHARVQAALVWWKRDASWVQALWRAISNYQG